MNDQELEGQLIRTMYRFHRFNRAAIFNHITRGEFFLLEILIKNKQAGEQGLHVSELAEALEVAAPGVSRMMGGLEKRGLLERSVNQADRRNTLVMVTPAGEAVLAGAMQSMQQFASNVLEGMGRPEMTVLIASWGRLLDVMENELSKWEKENTEPC